MSEQVFTHIRFQHSETKTLHDAYPGILGFEVGAVWTIKDATDYDKFIVYQGDQEALIKEMILAGYNHFEWRP